MNNKLPRRTFLLGWLSGLLGSCLGRVQAQASPHQPTTPTPTLDLTGSNYTPGETISFTAEGLPPGLSINSSTGLISGTVDCRQGNCIVLRVIPNARG